MIPKEKKVKINQSVTSAMYLNPISYIYSFKIFIYFLERREGREKERERNIDV